jgi:hypothetical protein
VKKPLFGIFSSVTKCNNTYLILCLVLLPVVVFFLFSKPWEIDHDFWEIATAVREVSVSLFHPSNPILTLPGYTSRIASNSL